MQDHEVQQAMISAISLTLHYLPPKQLDRSTPPSYWVHPSKAMHLHFYIKSKAHLFICFSFLHLDNIGAVGYNNDYRPPSNSANDSRLRAVCVIERLQSAPVL